MDYRDLILLDHAISTVGPFMAMAFVLSVIVLIFTKKQYKNIPLSCSIISLMFALGSILGQLLMFIELSRF